MANYAASLSSLRSIKNALLDRFPEFKSAHLSEALAAAAGFRSNAALLAHSSGDVPQDLLLDSSLFTERLLALGYHAIPTFEFGELNLRPRAASDNRSIKTLLPTEEIQMPKLFFSYCHVDEALRDRLEVHLSLLKHQKLIETWHDRGITAGSNFSDTIDENLEDADVILLLVSADFLASWYCYSVEMKRALERHHSGAARVIPVILEPCDWHSAPFGKLLAVPRDGKAVTTWANQAEAWTDAVRQIRKAVEEVAGAKEAAKAPIGTATAEEPASRLGDGASGLPSAYHAAPAATAGGPSTSERPRSSNLRLKKEFSDFDRDKFLHDSFEYMGKFFQASLEEVESRNPGIQVRFQPRSNESFAAIIYREGKAISECSIHLGGLGGRSQAMTFSYSLNQSSGSFNEMLSVDADSQSMFFKPLGMQARSSENSQLSEQGASEYFWGMFIERLQR